MSHEHPKVITPTISVAPDVPAEAVVVGVNGVGPCGEFANPTARQRFMQPRARFLTDTLGHGARDNGRLQFDAWTAARREAGAVNHVVNNHSVGSVGVIWRRRFFAEKMRGVAESLFWREPVHGRGRWFGVSGFFCVRFGFASRTAFCGAAPSDWDARTRRHSLSPRRRSGERARERGLSAIAYLLFLPA